MKNNASRKDISEMSFLDDVFFNTCFNDNIPATELLIRIILHKTLTVSEVKTQEFIRNLYGRSLQLDAHAKDDEGRHYNIEIQQYSAGADPMRLRYHASILDSNNVKPGTLFSDLPETYVIVITKQDYFGRGLPLYHVERYVEELKQPFNDKLHLIYVNSTYIGDDEIGKLTHDFREVDPDNMFYKVFKDSAKYYKYDAKGVKIMKSAYEERLEKVEYAKAVDAAKKLLTFGKLTHEEIAEAMGLTIEEVKALAGEASA